MVAYATLFNQFSGPFQRKMDDALVSLGSESELWALQMSHMTQSSPSRQGLLFDTNNFYTRHVLAEQVKRLLDGEVLTLGTVRLKMFNSINHPALKTAVE